VAGELRDLFVGHSRHMLQHECSAAPVSAAEGQLQPRLAPPLHGAVGAVRAPRAPRLRPPAASRAGAVSLGEAAVPQDQEQPPAKLVGLRQSASDRTPAPGLCTASSATSREPSMRPASARPIAVAPHQDGIALDVARQDRPHDSASSPHPRDQQNPHRGSDAGMVGTGIAATSPS